MQSMDSTQTATDDQSDTGTKDNQEDKKRFKLTDLYNTSSRLVLEAASILEEEIAAGIVAAKKAESRLINVKRLREADQENIMLRFRKDAHEVIDIVMDLVTAATQYIDKVAQMDIRFGENLEKKRSSGAGQSPPTIQMTEQVSAGESATFFMRLDNSSASETEEFRLYSTDLVNANGKRIAYRAIKFSPEAITIAPKDSSKVDVQIKVPKSATPGNYSGLIQAHNLEDLRAILVVKVT